MDNIILKVRKLVDRCFRKHIDLNIGRFAEYNEEDICRVLEYAAENGTSITWSAPHLRRKGCNLPDGDTVLRQLSKNSWQDLGRGFRGIINEQLLKAKKQRIFTSPVEIAIDFNEIEWYGEELHFIVHGQAKNGTRKFIRFACLSVLKPGRKFIVATVPVFSDTRKEDVIGLLLPEAEKWMKMRRIFIDRGFYGAKIPKMLDEKGLQYIMLARETKGIKKAMKSLLHKGKHIKPYTIRNRYGETKCTLFLCWDRKRRKWSPFITNIPVNERTRTALGKEYRQRWNIETSFRVKNGFLAKTSSMNYSVRYVIYMFAIVMYNFWILANMLYSLAQRPHSYAPEIRVIDFCFEMLDLIFPGIR